MEKFRIRIGYLLLIATFSMDLHAQPGSSDTDSNVNAAQMYTEHCAICHGDNGDGNTRAQSGLRPPPRNFTTLTAALELTRERMIDSVANGRPGTGMMPHKDRFSETQIAAVVDYIRENFMRSPDTSNKQLVKNEHGEKIYGRYCSVCHGDKGNSAVWAQSGLNPPPRDFTTAEAINMLTRERMIQAVTNGRPGTGMMPFTSKLDKKEIEAVVDYIRTAFMHVDANNVPLAGAVPEKTTTAAAQPQMQIQDPQSDAQRQALMRHAHATINRQQDPHQGPHAGGMPVTMPSQEPVVDADMSLPMPNGLEGNVQWGQQFFMSNCFSCHGTLGEGNGPRASFNTPRPRNFTSDESRRALNRVRLYNGINNGKVGTVMPAWGKVLSDQQVANVAEFVFQAYIRPQDYPEVASGIGATTTVSTEKKKAQ